MNRPDQIFVRLERANPVRDTAAHEPTRAAAIAFLRSLEEGTMDHDAPTNLLKRPQQFAGRRLTFAAAFVVVLVAGLVLFSVVGGDRSEPVGDVLPGSTTRAPSPGSLIKEPAELAVLREAVNAGDAAAAAAVHTSEDACDRFFTSGVETCSDWYAFLVGIGTNVVSAECEVVDSGGIGCEWTLGSEAHRALGIDSVEWRFTTLYVDGWSTALPDGNLLTGVVGVSELDDDFWSFVTDMLVAERLTNEETVALSNRVPTTLNAEFALMVLEAAQDFPRP